MPRGGPRVGAGRKPGSKNQTRKPLTGDSARVGRRRSPLEYLLDLLNDEAADALRRDRAAQALLPYCHSRPVGQPSSYNYVSKKEQAARDAETAGFGTEWWPLLHPDRVSPQQPPSDAQAPTGDEQLQGLIPNRPPTDWRDDLDPNRRS
jgi:hypothetical protein